MRAYCYIAAILLLLANIGLANGRFSQLVLTFSSKRAFKYSYDKGEYALRLDIGRITSKELVPLKYYDEQLIRRVSIERTPTGGAKVLLTLRDSNVRATVAEFTEPHRIIIDLFDNQYQTERDQVTGIPISNSNSIPASAAFGGEGTQLMQPDNFEAESQNNSESSNEAGKHRLMQPTPDILNEPNQLNDELAKIGKGIGPSWREFPSYIFRLETTPYTNEAGRQRWMKHATKNGMTGTVAMADYAGKLFDFGHESRALIAYQQVLYKDPKIFEKDALHLWKFAEIHLGRGNFTLANGYYGALIEKHPDSHWSSFAKIRKLDIAAIAAIRNGNWRRLPVLAGRLQQISIRNNNELALQIAFRKVYWQEKDIETRSASNLNQNVPIPTDDIFLELKSRNAKAESARSSLIAQSLILNSSLENTNPWSQETGSFAGEFFKRFKGPATEPFRSHIKNKLESRLIAFFAEKGKADQHSAVVANFEALPNTIRSIRKHAPTSWVIAESYRNLGRPAEAVKYYQAAMESSDKERVFRVHVWLATSAGIAESSGKQSDRKRMGLIKNSSDTAMLSIWKGMSAETQNKIYNTMANHLQTSIKQKPMLKSPPRIILSAMTEKLSTTGAAPNQDPSATQNSTTPTEMKIGLISSLAKRFGELGLGRERRQSLSLLKSINPSSTTGDSNEQLEKRWAEELVGLANEFRTDNDYLEAGRLYSLAGAKTANWQGRAEALFKGGLLLYRAGRREEALESFRKASEDTANKYYAEMAKERLDRLSQ